MKKIFFPLILFFCFYGFDCSDVNPVFDDICTITTEICFYAQEICQLTNSKTISKLNPVEIQDEIVSTSHNLQILYSNLQKLDKNLDSSTVIFYQSKLSEIRDELKELYENKAQKVE